MLKDMKAILYYFTLDYRFTFIVFWGILVSTLVGFTFISSLFEESSVIVFTGPIAFIFCAICGLNMTKETFPFCIKMGITRNQYIMSAGIFMVLFSTVMSFMHLLIKNNFEGVLSTFGIDGIRHYSMLQFLSVPETWFNELWVLGILNVVFLTIGFLVGTIFYRYGLIGGFGSVALLFFVIVLPATRDVLFEGLVEMSDGQASVHFGLVLLIAFIAFIPNWTFLRRASTIAARAR